MNFQIINLLVKCGIDYNHKKIRNYKLTDTEYMILSFCFSNPSPIQDDIVKGLKIDKTTLTKALISLESREYITRESNNTDRRKKIIILTDKAKKEISEILSLHDKWLDKIMSVLTENEKDNFENCCIKLLKASEDLRKDKFNEEF